MRLLLLMVLLLVLMPDHIRASSIKMKGKTIRLTEKCNGGVPVAEIRDMFKLDLYYDFRSTKLLVEKKGKALLVPGFNTLLLNGKKIELLDPPLWTCGNTAVFSHSFIKLVLPEIAGNTKFELVEDPLPHKLKKPAEEIITTESTPLDNEPFAALLARKGHVIKKVIIDPGHGGTDTGTGFGKNKEKDIVLDISRRLASRLTKKHGLQVIMSRNSDTTLPLEKRTEMANASGADLFISIHVNYSPNKYSRGLETYILNAKASDDESRKLALLENGPMSKDPEFRKASSRKNKDVKDILWDMEQNIFLQDSALAASMIHKQLIKGLGIETVKNRGVKQALFWVLSRVAMPAILVETGFISNAKDRSLLLNPKYRENFARYLAEGIMDYKRFLIDKSAKQNNRRPKNGYRKKKR